MNFIPFSFSELLYQFANSKNLRNLEIVCFFNLQYHWEGIFLSWASGEHTHITLKVFQTLSIYTPQPTVLHQFGKPF